MVALNPTPPTILETILVLKVHFVNDLLKCYVVSKQFFNFNLAIIRVCYFFKSEIRILKLYVNGLFSYLLCKASFKTESLVLDFKKDGLSSKVARLPLLVKEIHLTTTGFLSENLAYKASNFFLSFLSVTIARKSFLLFLVVAKSR